jgi:hypothetical protein
MYPLLAANGWAVWKKLLTSVVFLKSIAEERHIVNWKKTKTVRISSLSPVHITCTIPPLV